MPRGYWVDLLGEPLGPPQPFAGDCDDVRRRVSRHLAATGETKASLLRRMGNVNSNSLAKFMAKSGPYEGDRSRVYVEAKRLFGIITDVDADENADETGGGGGDKREPLTVDEVDATFSTKKRGDAFKKLVEELAGYEDVDDENFDWSKTDCNRVRARINEFVAVHGTKAALMKHLSVNSNSWQRFMSYTGKSQGANNSLYHSAALFFAKLDLVKRGKATKLGADDEDAPAATSLSEERARKKVKRAA